MSDPTITLLTELRQRVTRIESRLCRLGDHMGASMSDPAKRMRVEPIDETEVAVHLQALDIALSTLWNELKKQGIEGKVATIWFEGRHVASLYVQ